MIRQITSGMFDIVTAYHFIVNNLIFSLVDVDMSGHVHATKCRQCALRIPTSDDAVCPWTTKTVQYNTNMLPDHANV